MLRIRAISVCGVISWSCVSGGYQDATRSLSSKFVNAIFRFHSSTSVSRCVGVSADLHIHTRPDNNSIRCYLVVCVSSCSSTASTPSRWWSQISRSLHGPQYMLQHIQIAV